MKILEVLGIAVCLYGAFVNYKERMRRQLSSALIHRIIGGKYASRS